MAKFFPSGAVGDSSTSRQPASLARSGSTPPEREMRFGVCRHAACGYQWSWASSPKCFACSRPRALSCSRQAATASPSTKAYDAPGRGEGLICGTIKLQEYCAKNVITPVQEVVWVSE